MVAEVASGFVTGHAVADGDALVEGGEHPNLIFRRRAGRLVSRQANGDRESIHHW